MPRMPRLRRGQYQRPGDDDDLFRRAAAKGKRKRPSGRLPTTGKPHPEGWTDTRNIDKADLPPRPIAGAVNPNPAGYAPQGKHASRLTAQKSRRGRHRASEGTAEGTPGYSGRHKSERYTGHVGKHRR